MSKMRRHGSPKREGMCLAEPDSWARCPCHDSSAWQPGNHDVIVRRCVTMPFQGPQLVQSNLPHRAVHEGHVDGSIMPVHGEPAHAAAPGGRRIDLPPIAPDRRSGLARKRRVGGVRTVRGLAAVPGAIAQDGDAAGLLLDVGLPVQCRRIEPAVIARLQIVDPVIDAVAAIVAGDEALRGNSRSPDAFVAAVLPPVGACR